MNSPRLLVACGALWFASHAVAGDPGSIITQKARDVANKPAPQTPVRPAAAPAAPVARPVARPVPLVATNATVASALSPEQETALTKLVADLNVIKPGGTPTATQRAQVQKSLLALAAPADAPPADAVSGLANDLAVAWATQKMSGAQQARLASDLRKVMNSRSLKLADAQSTVASAQVLLKYGNVETNALQKVVADLNAIAATAKP